MVAWASDGTLSGYDSIGETLGQVYQFASPGSVDVNGVTRLGVFLEDATLLNSFKATAQLTLTAGDVTANGLGTHKSFGANLYLANANAFPSGTVPTPAQIKTAARNTGACFRSSTSHTTAGTRTYTITVPNSGRTKFWQPGNRYWIMVQPSIQIQGNSPTADVTPSGYTPDTIGRALSMWTNRTPATPTIMNPPTNSVVAPGDSFTLTYAPNDPDAVYPDSEAAHLNLDLAGVEFQYRPVPTADAPDPAWMPFNWRPKSGIPVSRSWEIRYTTTEANPTDVGEFSYLRADLGGPVVAGIDPFDTDTPVNAKGILPAGDWQIRCRTFDFGHPYPTTLAPGGKKIANAKLNGYRPDNYPSTSISPWSEAIRVSVPAQVPAPLAMNPRDETAVGFDTTVRLEWQYRNTHVPAYDQFFRTVQIRKVGDPTWTTVENNVSTDYFYDLPPSQAAGVPDTHEYITNNGFESGGTMGWTIADFAPDRDDIVVSGAAVTNGTTAGQAHSGTHYLRTVASPGQWPAAYSPLITFRDQDDTFVIDCWVKQLDTYSNIPFSMVWFDESGNMLDLGGLYAQYVGEINKVGSASWGGYVHFVSNPIPRYPGAFGGKVRISMVGNEPYGEDPVDMKIDDFYFTGTDPAHTEAFDLEVSTRYEWRVQVMDTDGKESAYSDPARFWVVPRQNSGDQRPVVSENIYGATLGCGTHTVEVWRRGGKVKVGTIGKCSYVDWERRRDEISTAKIVVSGWDTDCGNLLAKLQTWAYEVVIWRDNGYSKDRVWEGPITLLTYETSQVTIEAKDVMGYLYRRIIKQKMSDAGVTPLRTVVDRARRIIQNCFAPDDPNVLGYLRVISRDDDQKQFRSTPAYSKTAYEEIDDMAANAGLDYTVVGRSIVIWGTKHRIGTLPEFKDENLGNKPIVSEYGMSMANRYAVSNGDGIYGEATRLDEDGNDDTYGLVEMLSSTWASDTESDTGSYTQAGVDKLKQQFAEMSEKSIADRYPPPVLVRIPDNTTINPNTVVSIQQLVPGVVVPLRSDGTLRKYVGNQKLDAIKVVESEGKETISITLSAFNRDDITNETGTVG